MFSALRRGHRGQSLAEFAIIVPILAFLLLAIADFARLYATTLTVEAAAREAADFGTLYPWYWQGDPTDPASNAGKTVQGMTDRACKAASGLPDYLGPDNACVNPSFSYDLDEAAAGPGVTEAQCPTLDRTVVPCNVTVTLQYTFRIIAPVNIDFFGTTLGLPSSIAVERSSTFAISDFEIDEELEPTPPPTP